MGGVVAANLVNVTLQVEGTLHFSNDTKAWPRNSCGSVLECLSFRNVTDMTFTSRDGTGTLDGNGNKWWGIPGIGYLVRGEDRPRLLHIASSKDVLVEHLFLKNSPYWTFWAESMDGLEVRWTDIDARRDDDDGHDIIDITAFNTDGFDVTGRNVWIHDCNVWNQDDCIAVKDNSQDMVFERINASGVGLTIGSIASHVRNITFRDSYMHHSYKGIYMKFRGGGTIEDVLYENIVMDEPEQWAIWIGPAQQSDSDNLCAGHPCSICWPMLSALGAKCNAPPDAFYKNVTLRNITVNNPKSSPGVIIANDTSPMQGVTFDNVKINNPGMKPWGKEYYKCRGVASGVATGDTWPVPPCFTDNTTAALARRGQGKIND
jgi:polygalacturonase